MLVLRHTYKFLNRLSLYQLSDFLIFFFVSIYHVLQHFEKKEKFLTNVNQKSEAKRFQFLKLIEQFQNITSFNFYMREKSVFTYLNNKHLHYRLNLICAEKPFNNKR